MKTALRINLLLATLLGFALPGLGQGSLSRFTTVAPNTLVRGKSFVASSTNGFTISAQRDFDYSVAISVTTATRYWFQDSPRQSEVLVAAGRYENATLWAQATPVNPRLAFAATGRSPDTHAVTFAARNMDYRQGNTITGFDAAISHYDESQTPVWLQGNIRFANVNPVP